MVVVTVPCSSLAMREFLERIEGRRKGDRWSNLPDDLVWMIKARLDYPNNLRFASVCKRWLHASLDYQPIVDARPWLMVAENTFGSKREFISASTGEKYTIDLPDFCDAHTLFSKQGWLFLVNKKCLRRGEGHSHMSMDTESDSPFFLLNPFKKVKIKLPHLAIAAKDVFEGAFDLVDGNPCCVVVADFFWFQRDPFVKVAVTHPGDNTWATYTHRCPGSLTPDSVSWVFVIGELVYCLQYTTCVYYFDLANLEWTEPMRNENQVSHQFHHYVMVSEGKVFQVRLGGDRGTNAVFYELNDSKTYWEPLRHKDLEDTCWLLGKRGQRFSFRFKGKEADKIYTSCKNLAKDGCVNFNIHTSYKNLEAKDGCVNFDIREHRNLLGQVREKTGQLIWELTHVYFVLELTQGCVYWVDMG
ncbi:hypothetical protein Vadar_021849 [Vaccinium darrowii]|uniref:Uncharacterized protein n=1 Tax=Vaccinium darrowii TaxID=229202 RepID=A0ACB7YFP6_9ERIC|nr:hypothetical protein Vadar_021849 [Vaccinium darrowii]